MIANEHLSPRDQMMLKLETIMTIITDHDYHDYIIGHIHVHEHDEHISASGSSDRGGKYSIGKGKYLLMYMDHNLLLGSVSYNYRKVIKFELL